MVAINEKLMPGAERQNLPASDYYLLQDTLYRAAALTDSSGNIVEAYDCDAYGNTIAFTAADSSGNWWSDSATQSNFGANEIIFCGYRYDPETENYYVRNRYYSPTLGRWLTRDPIGYAGGINLYEYVGSSPAGNVDPAGAQPISLPPVGGYAETNFNNQETTTTVYPYGESLNSYQLTPGGPAPLGPAYVPSASNFLRLGGFGASGWENAIARGTVKGAALGFATGSFMGPEGAVMGELGGELAGFLKGLIGYPVRKFVLGAELYYLRHHGHRPARPRCRETPVSRAPSPPIDPYVPYGPSGPTYVPGGPSWGFW